MARVMWWFGGFHIHPQTAKERKVLHDFHRLLSRAEYQDENQDLIIPVDDESGPAEWRPISDDHCI